MPCYCRENRAMHFGITEKPTRDSMLGSMWAGALGYSAVKIFSKYSNLQHASTLWTRAWPSDITVHNQALMNVEQNPTEGFDKLQFLIQHIPFPPETFPNLLLLYVKYDVSEVFLQRVSIACSAEHCTSYSKSVRLSVCPSVCPLHPGTVSKRLKLRSCGLQCRIAPWLVSSSLTSPQNSKGNIGSEGAEWERGRKNRQFLANKSPR